MTTAQRTTLGSAAIGAVLLLATGCRDVNAPTTGTLRVSVATTGGDLDLDGYAVALDADAPRSVAANATLVFPGLSIGSHDVALSGVAANCAVVGLNALSVTISGGDTTRVSFAIGCFATGVQVTTATLGVDTDPDGYGVAVDGGPPQPLGANGTVAITRLSAGSHTVELGGIAANCAVGGSNPRSVDVTAGQTVPVAFAVTCVATTGVVEVIAATSGPDPDPTGYTVRVDNGSPATLVVNGKTTFPGASSGDHTILLDGVAENCTIAGTNPRTVSVTTGGVTRDTARTTFQVTCVAVTGVVDVTAMTTGAPLDPSYTARVDGSSQSLAPNGRATFTNVSAGDHSVRIIDVASHCNVAGANPRTVSVTTGGATRDTARTTFEVTCYATTGAIEVTTTTSGIDLDPNGYTLILDGDDLRQLLVATNGFLRIDPASIGSHTLALGGVAGNCTVSGGNTHATTVASGATAALAFTVTCAALGGVQVTVVTTGVDLDPNGYSAAIAQTGFSGTGSVPTNGSATISGLVAGDYTVTLHGVAVNCDVTSPTPRMVTVPSGGTSAVAFDVACVLATPIAFTRSGDIYVIKSNGTGGVTTLTTALATDGEPAWSADGSRIAFLSERDGNSEIYVMDANGLNQTRRTNDTRSDHYPTWSPDGTKIAFMRIERDGNTDIYAMNADGTSPVRLTSHTARDSDPAWSSDGSKIAFSSARDGNDEIYVMNVDGSGVTRLTNNSAADVQPDWSPDGTKLAFSRLTACDYYFCDYDLYIMNADGSGATQLTSGTSDADPTWSPDGRWIAFAASFCNPSYYGCDYSYTAVHLVRTDGSGLTELLRDASQPAW